MLATIEDVRELTNYEVNLGDIRIAQGIIESFVGLSEAEITDANDRVVMGRAICYQAAYVSKNYERVFEQMGVRSLSDGDSAIVVDVDLGSPFLAPLASFALRHMSRRGARSVKTGAIFGGGLQPTPWELN